MFCPFLYGGELAVALQRLKYRSRSDIARAVGRWIGPALSTYATAVDADFIVPIPSHWLTRLHRGMDHMVEVAQATRSQVPVISALQKTRRTPRQAGLTRTNRHRNVAGCFRVRRRWRRRLEGARVVVIDDIATTTATMQAAAMSLQQAGCVSISAFAVARAEP